jgi:serine protease
LDAATARAVLSSVKTDNHMSRKLILSFSVLLVLITADLSAATRYIVALRGPVRSAKVPMVQDAALADTHEVRRFENFNSFAADLTDDEVATLRKSRDVRYVQEVHERHLLDTTPAAPGATVGVTRYSTQQFIPPGITATHAPELWPLTHGLQPVNVVIIDTGIDPAHPDLAENYAGGFNTLQPGAAPFDDNGHGTHVAGTVGAGDNGFGVVGMAPKVRIWSVKTLDLHGTGSSDSVIFALDWTLSQQKALGGHWIVSLSLGAHEPDEAEREAFQRIYDAGVLAIAAAGNSGFAAVEYPGAYPTVLSAGAVDDNNVRAPFSSYGVNIGVMAPGVNVLSTARVGTYSIADVQTDTNVTLNAFGINGSPKRDVWAPIIDCNIGNPEDFPPETPGRIAVIQRGCGPNVPLQQCNFTFNQKVKNAIDAGASAAIIYNTPNTVDNLSSWTLIRKDCDDSNNCVDYKPDVDFPWILATAMTLKDAQALLSGGAHNAVESFRNEDYFKLSGTSMATPHVSGGAALVWSLAPDATSNDVRKALISGTTDIGDPGYDPFNGFGMLNVLTSAKILAPQLFGLPTQDPGPKRRPNG